MRAISDICRSLMPLKKSSCLQVKARPFDEVDFRSADDDALAARVECVVQSGDHLPLGSLLARVLGRQRKDELQCLRERRGRCPQRLRPPGHQRPFLTRGFLDVAPDQGTNPRFRVCRKARGEHHDGSQRAGLPAHTCTGALVIAPDLRGGKSYEKTEDDAKWWQHTRRNGFERPRALARCEHRHEPIAHCCDQVGEPEDYQCHPRHRQIVQPAGGMGLSIVLLSADVIEATPQLSDSPVCTCRTLTAVVPVAAIRAAYKNAVMLGLNVLVEQKVRRIQIPARKGGGKKTSAMRAKISLV
jgi:hypothetical protein